MSVTTMESSCPTCSATSPINPEDVVIACNYCGTVYTIGKEKIADHNFYQPKYSLAEAEKRIYKFIKRKTRFRGFNSYGGLKIRKTLVPYWVFLADVKSFYNGYGKYTRTETERDKDGNIVSQKTTTYYERRTGNFEDEKVDALICRLGARIFGLEKLEKRIETMIRTKPLQPFNQKELLDDMDKISFLSGEITSYEAKEMLETKIQDEYRLKAENACTELFDCRTHVNVKNMVFLHYPIFIAEYTFGAEKYRVLVDGVSGDVIDAEIPITTRLRVASFILLLLLFIVNINYTFIQPIENDNVTAMMLFTLFALFAGYKLTNLLFGTVSRGS